MSTSLDWNVNAVQAMLCPPAQCWDHIASGMSIPATMIATTVPHSELLSSVHLREQGNLTWGPGEGWQ